MDSVPSFQPASETNTIREVIEFSRRGSSLRFQANVNLSSEGIIQPKEISIFAHGFDSDMEFPSCDVSYMRIQLPISNITSQHVHIRTLEFLCKLFGKNFENLLNLLLEGIHVLPQLWAPLSKLSLKRLSLTCPLLDYYVFDRTTFPGFKELHLNLGENCDLSHFPHLPSSLEALYLCISNLKNNSRFLNITHCKKLEKM